MDNIRKDFPAYPTQGIYLDSATINLQPQSVIDAQTWYNANLGSTLRKSLYKRSRKSTEIYLDTKERLALQYGGLAESYVFFPNLDYTWNVVIMSIIQYHKRLKLEPPTFLTSIFEEHSLLAPLIQFAKSELISLRFIEKEDSKNFYENLEEIAQNGEYIAISHLSPLNGTYRKLDEISKLAKEYECKLFVDLSRSAGQNPIRIPQCDIDVAIIDPSLDLLGPQGICVAYLSDYFFNIESPLSGTNSVKEVKVDDVMQLSSYERFEIGNLNLPALNGLKVTFDYYKQLTSNWVAAQRESLQNHLRELLADIETITPIAPNSDFELPGSVISVRMKGVSSHDIILLLEEAFSIELRSGTLCSHPGLKYLLLDDVLTISTHVYNSIDEIDTLFESLEQARIMLKQ